METQQEHPTPMHVVDIVRLITGNHYHGRRRRRGMILGNCAEAQSDGEGEEGGDDYDDRGAESCFYSKPVVVLDLIWNLAFVFVSGVVLFTTIKERPSSPLRIWIFGYALQCVLHVAFVYLQFKRWNEGYLGTEVGNFSSLSSGSILKRLESINTMTSSVWWVLGFYWIVAGGQALLQDSPRLYWLTVVFLAFDVFFIIFCVGMACIIFLALFCCIPIVAIAYAFAIREGASENDIRRLPKYRYCQACPSRTFDNEMKQALWTKMELSRSNSRNELALCLEDSECCICLSQYVDGVELCSLPCNHHFHSKCISKWLRINATCPLCKFDIRQGDTLV